MGCQCSESCFRTKDANKTAAYGSVCPWEKCYVWNLWYNLLSHYFVDITGEISHVLSNLCLTLLWIYNTLSVPKYLSYYGVVSHHCIIISIYLSGLANVMNMSRNSAEVWFSEGCDVFFSSNSSFLFFFLALINLEITPYQTSNALFESHPSHANPSYAM